MKPNFDMKSNKVFCIGLSKTGTLSLSIALRRLGYKTSHGRIYGICLSNFINPEKLTTEMFITIDAASDIPIVLSYSKLDELFPNAKFILTTRDLESWLKSCSKNFSKEIMDKRINLKFGPIENEAFCSLYHTPYFKESNFIETYDNHILNINKRFKGRKDKILELNIFNGDSWSKLCPFIGESLPHHDDGFPWVNKSKYDV